MGIENRLHICEPDVPDPLFMDRREFLECGTIGTAQGVAQALLRAFAFCYPSLIYLCHRNGVLEALVLSDAHSRVVISKVEHGVGPLLEIFQILIFLRQPLPLGIPAGADGDPHGVGLASLAGEFNYGTIGIRKSDSNHPLTL